MAHATKARALKRMAASREASRAVPSSSVVHRVELAKPVRLVVDPYGETPITTWHASVEAAKTYAIAQYPESTRYHIHYKDRFGTKQVINQTNSRVVLKAHVSGMGGIREDFNPDKVLIKKRSGGYELIRRSALHMARATAYVNETDKDGQWQEPERIKGLSALEFEIAQEPV